MTQERTQQLRKAIDRADYAYYNGGGSHLSDEQYDALKHELLTLVPGDERNSRFGPPALPPMAQKVRHLCFMGSLRKCDDADGLRHWYDDAIKKLPDGHQLRRRRLSVSIKADGGSVALYYHDGKLLRAVTRGGDDGVGEDITANALSFEGVPTQLPTRSNLAVRGEVVLTVDKWTALDPQHTSNPRNLGNGIMRRLDRSGSDQLTFLAFDVEAMKGTFPDEIVTESDKITYLASAGFTTVKNATFTGVEEAISWYQEIAEQREDLPMWIDGVVFKLDDLVLQRSLGVHDNRPRGQAVLKFDPDGAISKLLGLTLTVGHTGAIIPTGKIEPVRIGGTTISSVLLNNFQLIRDLDLAIGDQVRVIKAKDIVPQLVEVIGRPVHRQVIDEPTTCPVCGYPAGRRSVGPQGNRAMGALTECKNQECPARADARLKTWITKLGILGIGDEVLTGLINQLGVRTPADLYRLAGDRYRLALLAELKVGAGRLGEKRAALIAGQVLAKRTMPIHVFIGSLGIPHLGRRRAELIMAAIPGQFETIKDWLDVDRLIRWAEAASVPNVALAIAAGINMFRDQIVDLSGLITITPPAETVAEPNVAVKVFVLTGAMSKSRKDITAAIEAAGHRVSDSIIKGVDYLVQADPDSKSTKAVKATKLGIKVISEDELWRMLS